VREGEVVAAIVAGDPAGLAAAYDRYAVSLYNFCATILREPADAADAVHDTFVVAASRLSGLRDPERFGPWLYAVARNECHRRLRGGSRQVPFEEAADVTDEAADIAANVEKAELRALVRDALNGLGSTEREVLELQLRQGLTSGEVASILRISRNHVHALLSRARDQLETSLGVLVVARAGRRDCPALDALLENWDDQLTVLLRKRVNQHVQRCLACSGRRRVEMTPAMLLGAAPLVSLPLAAHAIRTGLRDQVLRAATGNSPAAMAHGAAVTRTAYTFGRHGFPRPLDPPRAQWWHQRPAHVAALAGTTAAVASAVIIVAAPPHHGPRPPAGKSVGVTGVSPTASGNRATARAGVAPGGSGTPASAAPAHARASTSASAAVSGTPVSGTLSVSPATLVVVPPAPGTIRLAASGGPVAWSVSESPGLAKKVIVSPMSGTLAVGATETVSVTVDGPGKMHVHLVFNPGGARVTVVISGI
jgi:RNA polymerase sigma factor (sigma-70 family)